MGVEASAEGAKHVTSGRGGAAEFSLPPGPRIPSLFQTMGWWMRPISFLERNRARYGKRFTIRLLGERVFVMLSDPADVKQVYTSPPDVLHPG
jgi:cytochrome P450